MTDLLKNSWPYLPVLILCNILWVILLPFTQGLTRPLPTIAFVISGMVAAAMWPLMLQQGIKLSLLGPLVSAVVPVLSIAVGKLMNGEEITLAKVSLLMAAVACVSLSTKT